MLYLFINWEPIRHWLVEHSLSWVVTLISQTQFRAIAAAGLAFVLVIAFGKRTIMTLQRLKIGDSGLSDAEVLRTHTASKANTPTMGGILIAGAIGVCTVLLADLSQFYVVLALIVLGWLAAVGGADDYLKLTAANRGAGSRQGLYSWEKLVFQLGLGLLVGIFIYKKGDVPDVSLDMAHVLTLPFQRTWSPGGAAVSEGLIYLPRAVFIVLAVLMIAGMSNAVNITDGMDGLASGITAVVGIGLVALTLVAGSMAAAQYLLVPHIPFADELAIVAGAMVGSCLGFLWWNCAPAQVFMGDTGSLSLGGLIAYMAVVVRQEIVVLLMCGVFLLEIGSVVLQVGYFKYSKGKRIFRCAPFHHHLHLSGWAEQQVVARLWIVAVFLVAFALASIKLR